MVESAVISFKGQTCTWDNELDCVVPVEMNLNKKQLILNIEAVFMCLKLVHITEYQQVNLAELHCFTCFFFIHMLNIIILVL